MTVENESRITNSCWFASEVVKIYVCITAKLVFKYFLFTDELTFMSEIEFFILKIK